MKNFQKLSSKEGDSQNSRQGDKQWPQLNFKNGAKQYIIKEAMRSVGTYEFSDIDAHTILVEEGIEDHILTDRLIRMSIEALRAELVSESCEAQTLDSIQASDLNYA